MRWPTSRDTSSTSCAGCRRWSPTGGASARCRRSARQPAPPRGDDGDPAAGLPQLGGPRAARHHLRGDRGRDRRAAALARFDRPRHRTARDPARARGLLADPQGRAPSSTARPTGPRRSPSADPPAGSRAHPAPTAGGGGDAVALGRARTRLHLPRVERSGPRGPRPDGRAWAHRRHRPVGLWQVHPPRAGRRAPHADRRLRSRPRRTPPRARSARSSPRRASARTSPWAPVTRCPTRRSGRRCATLGLDGVVAAQPAGLDTPLGDDGRGLSAGQRARLVLARAQFSAARRSSSSTNPPRTSTTGRQRWPTGSSCACATQRCVRRGDPPFRAAGARRPARATPATTRHGAREVRA